jgi:hypothetical protein
MLITLVEHRDEVLWLKFNATIEPRHHLVKQDLLALVGFPSALHHLEQLPMNRIDLTGPILNRFNLFLIDVLRVPFYSYHLLVGCLAKHEIVLGLEIEIEVSLDFHLPGLNRVVAITRYAEANLFNSFRTNRNQC